MDLEKELLKQPSPQWTAKLSEFVLAKKSRFLQLMHIFLNLTDDYRLNQRATLIILEAEKQHPSWVVEQVPHMVNALQPTIAVALKRNLLRILQNHQIPEDQWGHAADQCFRFLASAEEPVAVKVFSMTVLYNLTRQIPELAVELKILIEDQFQYGSAGFKARGRKVLKALQRDGY